MRRNFEKLGMRRWKRDKRYGILILFLVAISFFLMEFTFLISDSLEATLAERRKEAYGNWQYALLNIPEEEISHARQNPFLEQSGLLWTAGRVETEELVSLSFGVGGADAGAVSMTQAQLMEGRLPEKAGEAAVEAAVLERLEIIVRHSIGLHAQLVYPRACSAS